MELATSIGHATYQIIQCSVKSDTKVGLRKAQAILRLAEKYSKERLEAACLRASKYDNYTYNSLCNILSNELDKIKTPSPPKVKNIDESAYVRSSEEYVSDMGVNYV